MTDELDLIRLLKETVDVLIQRVDQLERRIEHVAQELDLLRRRYQTHVSEHGA